MLGWAKLVAQADSQESEGPTETVTPIRFADVIACDATGERKVVRMRWGFLPPGTKDVLGATPHIHARAETIDVKPTFRAAFAARRGLLIVSSFNEGREVTAKKTEQYVLSPTDGQPIAIAVIYEPVQDRNGGTLLTFAMVTVPPSPLIATITDRMPALIDAPDWPVWLGETGASLDRIKALLRTATRELAMEKEKRQPPPSRPGQGNLF